MENSEQKFTYYAFVSYSHQDEKWAKWIQDAIEHYKLPAIIRKEAQKPLPKKIAPVFRDATDLGVDVLVDSLHSELEQSRFLIVVCSPRSAAPNAKGKHYVDSEVRHFLELGRAKQIIPVIVEGSTSEAFCPSLKDSEILALDATKIPKERILNDIVAKIIGLRPDELWRRAERERRHRQQLVMACCFAMALLVAFCGYFAIDANRTVANYYADYVDSFGLPEGIFPLKKEELKRRHFHYRFEYRGFQYGKSPHADSANWNLWKLFGFRRRLVRVVQANSLGYPCVPNYSEYSERPQIQDFAYDRKNRLCEIRYGCFNGEDEKPRLKKRIELYTEKGGINDLMKFFAHEGQLGNAFDASSATVMMIPDFLQPPKTEVMQHLVQRDENGRISRRLFMNYSGEIVTDSDGLCGFSYDYDVMGRQKAQWYLLPSEKDFEKGANKKGVAGKKYDYRGRTRYRIEYVDVTGSPIISPQGWMICEDSFDEFDNNTESWYLDGKSRKILRTDGYAGNIAKYDEYGNMTYISFHDMEGKLTINSEGYAAIVNEYDKYGHEIKTSFYGLDGKLTYCDDGNAVIRAEYDKHGNMTDMSYYDVNDKPTLIIDGYFRMKIEYDEHGNMTKVSYYDTDDRLILLEDGMAGWVAEYDERGNKTKQTYYNADWKETLVTGGFASWEAVIDPRGNISQVSFLDVDGTGILHSEGYAKMLFGYDEHGNRIKQAFYGLNNEPVLCKEGFAEVRWEYDRHGNRLKESYYGEDGKPEELLNAGYAEWRAEYDEHGNMARQLFYGIDGKRKSIKEGFAEIRWTYNDYGHRTKEEYLDLQGNLTVGENGYARMMCSYDTHGNRIREAYYGVDGKPMLNPNGVAEMRCEYDDYGNRRSVSCHGLDGALMRSQEGYAKMLCNYDVYGNMTMVSFLGSDNEPIALGDGYAKVQWSYDEHGNKTKESYYGVNGKPTLHQDGYVELHRKYDPLRNMIEESYYGLDGKPTYCRNGYAETHFEYDVHRNKIRQSFHDRNGKLMLLQEGYAEVRMKYDIHGNMTKLSVFDTDGKLTLCKNGYAEIQIAYDMYGEVEREEFFDTLGQLVHITQTVVYTAEITSASEAEKQGVQVGDIWCHFDSYDILKSKSIYEVVELIETCENKEKELIVARKDDDDYQILTFKFPVGHMGIRASDMKISDILDVQKAYKAYCEKIQTEKQ